MPRPVSVKPSGKLIDITLPLAGTSTKLNVNATTTAQEVVDIVTKCEAYQGTTYAFGLAPAANIKQPVDPSAPIISHPVSAFTVIISGIRADVHLEQRGTREQFQFGSDFTVRECIHFIEQCNCHGSIYSSSNLAELAYDLTHELYLVENVSQTAATAPSCLNGTRMEPDRMLSSYRLRLDHALVFARSRSCLNLWKQEESPPEMALAITMPVSEEGTEITKTLTFPLDTTYADVIRSFFEKANVRECSMFYGLYVEDESGGKNTVHYLHSDWTLKTYHLPSSAKLVCKKRSIPARRWFGVDPTTLPMGKDPDNGIMVPEVLLMLKEILVNLNGYKTEGIFRKAGLESEMERIRTQLETGNTFVSYNEHTIATLLKRWFKALPQRLLSKMDRTNNSDEFILNYPRHLDLTSSNLLSWILDLILKVVRHGDENFMTPKNCAIVWGPCLVGQAEEETISNETDMMASIQDTGFASGFITKNISRMVEQSLRPHGVEDLSIAGMTAECLFDHPKQLRGELDMRKGDVVTIIADSSSEWYFVQLNFRFGFAAKNYLQLKRDTVNLLDQRRRSAKVAPPTSFRPSQEAH